jgi:hypothetical protein
MKIKTSDMSAAEFSFQRSVRTGDMPAGRNIMQMKGLGSLESNEPSHASGVAGSALPVTISPARLCPIPVIHSTASGRI